LKPPNMYGVGDKGEVKQLQGHVVVEKNLTRSIDSAHAALTQQFQHLVFAAQHVAGEGTTFRLRRANVCRDVIF
jgi:hypothetical protein